MPKAFLIVGAILALLGLFYLLAPHATHVSTIGFGLDHSTHQILGVVLLVIGAVVIWKKK